MRGGALGAITGFARRSITGLTVRPVLPDLGAVARSLLGVLLVAGVALYVADAGSAVASAGAAAIAGAVALQDSPRGRFRLVASVAGLMSLAVLLASFLGGSAPLFAVLVAGWCFAAGLTWAISADAGLVAAAATALLVVTPAATPSWPNAVWAASLALLGGLTQALLIVLWPRRRWRVQRTALTRAYRSVAADCRTLATDPSTQVATEPLIFLRNAFTLTEAQAARRPLAYRAWYGLPERLAATLGAIAVRTPISEPRSRALEAAADVLDAVATPSRSRLRDASAALTRYDAAVAYCDSALLRRLAAQLRDAVELRFGTLSPPAEHLSELRRAALPSELVSMVAAMRAQVRWDSPVLRHAIRLAVAAHVGVVVGVIVDLEHGYWIPLTVVMVLRPETAHTYTRCVGRVAGNAAGVVVASLVVLVFQPSGSSAAILAVAFLAVTYAVSSVGYVAVSAALAAAIVFLVDIGGTLGVDTVSDRLFATLIGGALAVLAHVALPDHDEVRLRQRAGELLKTEIDYAATVIKAFVHQLDDPGAALSAAWERAYRARAAFEAAAGAGATDDREFRRWLRSYRTGLNVVTASCTALEASLPARPPAGWDDDFVVAIDDYVEALSGDPATPGSAWTADLAQLSAAMERVRAALPSSDAAVARVLVSELATITQQLAAISGPSATAPTSG